MAQGLTPDTISLSDLLTDVNGEQTAAIIEINLREQGGFFILCLPNLTDAVICKKQRETLAISMLPTFGCRK